MVDIGLLNRRFVFQSPTRTTDDFGGVVISWTDEASRWGSLRGISGRDRQNADQISTEVTHEIIVRKDSKFQPKSDWRATNRGRTFNVKDVIDVDDRSRYWTIEVVEVPDT